MQYFPQGGYAVFELPRGKAVFRCPRRFRHRPAHCDLLHLDLWHGGINLLRDSGTYSYNCQQPWQDYFKSTAAHNTIQFDDHDQMPKLTRFLFGKWPALDVDVDQESAEPRATAGFTDWQGCSHKRTVIQTQDGVSVTDEVTGFQNHAVLRWRLAPECRWALDNNHCVSGAASIEVESEDAALQIELTEGWESLHYLEKTKIPVLEVTIQQPTTITTHINLSA